MQEYMVGEIENLTGQVRLKEETRTNIAQFMYSYRINAQMIKKVKTLLHEEAIKKIANSNHDKL